MIELLGASAVSDFRIAKLRPALEAIHPGIGAISARFVHFVDVARDLDARETTLLERLLTYGPREHGDAESSSAATTEIVVVPRFGTISPWSSKATDIAHVCGLDAVRRIERGIVWRIAGTKKLPPAEAMRLAAPLFDRMTEAALLERGDAARLFVREKARSLRTVSLASGRDALVTANSELGLALSDDEIDYLVKNFATLGRDHYVKVVYAGYLLPFGHHASFIKVSERKFEPSDPSQPTTKRVAALRQRFFIVVREHVKTYPGAGTTHGWFDFPFPQVEDAQKEAA